MDKEKYYIEKIRLLEKIVYHYRLKGIFSGIGSPNAYLKQHDIVSKLHEDLDKLNNKGV